MFQINYYKKKTYIEKYGKSAPNINKFLLLF